MKPHGGGMVGLAGDHVVGPAIGNTPDEEAAARCHVARHARDLADELMLLDALGLGEG